LNALVARASITFHPFFQEVIAKNNEVIYQRALFLNVRISPVIKLNPHDDPSSCVLFRVFFRVWLQVVAVPS
jgi:hypothetical protein